jgi:hypothetical protein
MLTEALANIVSDQLRPDEKLLWYGRPRPLRMARAQLMPVVMGVVWIAFVGFMLNVLQNQFSPTRNAFSSNSFSGFQTIFTLVLIVFVGVGLWMVSTPVRNYLRALNTYYALTDQRAIIISKLFSMTIISYTKRDIRSVRRVEYGDGTGDVIFGWDEVTYTDYDDRNAINVNFDANRSSSLSFGPRQRTYRVAIGFKAIPDAQAVETLMMKTLLAEEESR